MRNFASTLDNRMFDFSEYYDWIAKEMPQGAKMVEVGNADGASSIHLCEAMLNLGKSFTLHMVDNMAYGKYNQMKTIYENVIKAGVAEYVNIIPMDSVKASKLFNGNSLDFVFLDSSHQYFPTLKEVKSWYECVKEGCIISGHDYNSSENPGVREAVDQLLPHTIKRATIDDKINDHYQEFQPEQLLHTFDTSKNLQVWWCRKRFYFKP